MHDHLTDERIPMLRPKGSRIEGDGPATAGRAAGFRRTDALDADALLGLQRSAGNGAVAQLMEDERSPVHDVITSSGRPLDGDVREDMEGRLGHDFSDVRLHDDTAAAASAQAVNAHAYTVGSHIVFQRDTYDPSSTQGRTTLAHELTHVVQQRSGPVDGTSAPGGIKVSNPSAVPGVPGVPVLPYSGLPRRRKRFKGSSCSVQRKRKRSRFRDSSFSVTPRRKRRKRGPEERTREGIMRPSALSMPARVGDGCPIGHRALPDRAALWPARSP